MRLLRLFIRTILIFIVCSSVSFAQGYREDFIIINMSGITLIVPPTDLSKVETQSSTLGLSSDSSTGTYIMQWAEPIYDSERYTLVSDHTFLQERDDSGEWITIAPESYGLGISTSYTKSYQVTGKSSGVYEYRLIRDFKLKDKNTSLSQQVIYPEESNKIVVWEAADLSKEPRIWPFIITIPSTSLNGNYTVEFTVPKSYRFENGKIYSIDSEGISIDYTITNLETGVSTSRHFEFRDNSDGFDEIINQPPGTYELKAILKGRVEFRESWLLADQLGLFDGEEEVEDFFSEFTFIDNQPQRIVVKDVTLENLTARVDRYGNVFLIWPSDFASQLNEVEFLSPQGWRVIYRGTGSSYLASNVGHGELQFRVRSCEDEGVCTKYVTQTIQVDEVAESECIPFDIE